MSDPFDDMKCDKQVYRPKAGYRLCGRPAVSIGKDGFRCKRHEDKPVGPVEIWWMLVFSKYAESTIKPVRVTSSSPGYVTLEGSKNKTARASDWGEFFPTWTDAVNRLMDLTRQWADQAKAELLKAEGRMAQVEALAKAGPPEVKADG